MRRWLKLPVCKRQSLVLAAKFFTTSRSLLQAPSEPPRLQYLTIEQLHIELVRGGRRKVENPSYVAKVVDEIIARTDRRKKILLRDAMFVASSAKLYSRCTELFLTSSISFPNQVALPEVVVDAAYEQESSHLLTSLVDSVARRLVDAPLDVSSEVSVYRAFWLCALRSLEAEQSHLLSVAQRRGVDHVNASTQIEYQRSAEHIYSVLAQINARFSRTLAASSPVEASAALSCSAHSHQTSEEGDSFTSFWAFAKRCARYNYATDGGECQFYFACYSRGYFRTPHAAGVIASLIRSCQRSQNIFLIKEYYRAFVARVRDAEVHNATMLSAQNAGDGSPQNENEEGKVVLHEVVVHMYLQAMVNARCFLEVLNAAKHLLSTTDKYLPSYSVIAVISRAAGEVKSLDIALQCANAVFQNSELMVNFAGDDSTVGWRNSGLDRRDRVGNVSVSSSARGLPSAYELFMIMMGLAKCHAQNFIGVLESVQLHPQMRFSDEEALCLKLHYYRRSHSIREFTDTVVEMLDSKPLATLSLLTPRNMTLILLLLQSCEHDRFFQFLMEFCAKCEERRLVFLSIALQWMEPRRFQAAMTVEKKWVLQELRALLKVEQANAVRRNDAAPLSLWDLMRRSADAVGDAAAFKSATAIFLTDCCNEGLLAPMEAFQRASLEWPDDDSALRFCLNKRQLLPKRSSFQDFAVERACSEAATQDCWCRLLITDSLKDLQSEAVCY